MVTIFGTVKWVKVESYSQHLSPRHHGEQPWQPMDTLQRKPQASLALNRPQNRLIMANSVHICHCETGRRGMYGWITLISYTLGTKLFTLCYQGT